MIIFIVLWFIVMNIFNEYSVSSTIELAHNAQWRSGRGPAAANGYLPAMSGWAIKV